MTSGVESQSANFARDLASASGSVAGRRPSGVCVVVVVRPRARERDSALTAGSLASNARTASLRDASLRISSYCSHR